MKNFSKLLYSLLIVFLIGFIASYFTRVGISFWYHRAVKSIFTPPDSVFPPVWTSLYLLMALSYYGILLIRDRKSTQDARLLFLSQLLLQVVWCFAFFYKGQPAVGFAVILLLDYLVWKTIRAFYALRPLSSYLLYPYFAWLCYATFLNLLFVIQNGLIVDF